MTPPNTTLKIQRTIQLLSSLEHQDIIKYRKEFLDIMALCNWNEQTANDVLISLTSSNLLHLYAGQETLNKKFDTLIWSKYPKTDSLKYYSELTTLKQCDFLTIEEYQKRIESTCYKLGNCKRWSKETIMMKIEESFYNGLTRRTQLEMARLNVKTLGEMYQIIHTTESTMLEQLRATQARTRKRSEDIQTHNKNKNTHYRTIDRIKTEKYCKFHHSTSHSDEECKARKQHPQPKSGSSVIKEQKTTDKNIEIKGIINNLQLKILIDTGSTHNYINDIISKELNAKTNIISPYIVEMANGQTVTVDKSTTLDLKLEADNSRIYNVDFKIMPHLSSDMLIGLAFLSENEALNDLKNE